jgi:hypothetical protein
MIDLTVFTEEMIELQAHFGKTLNDRTIARYKAIFDEALTTNEFKKGVIWAYRHLKPHPSFFPSPQEMIEAAQGSIRDRALIEWSSHDKSEVGRKALAFCDSEKMDFRRKEFIENFLAFAKDAAPDKLQIKAIPAIAPSTSDRPRLRKPNPLTWTAEQENWTYEQWESYLREQNQSDAAIYATY